MKKAILLGWYLLLFLGINAQEFDALVFSKTAGYRHESIETGVEALQKLALEYDFSMYHTEDAGYFTDENLSRYDVIMFLNTTGDILNDAQQNSMERFIQRGKGFVGIHSASDTEYDWPWYVKLVGANFESHPKVQEARLKVVDHNHLSTQILPSDWIRTDEWYNFKNMNPDVHVLLELDENTYDGGNHGVFHPFAWYHQYDGGRAFYTCCGHTPEAFGEHAFLTHLMGGLIYAVGKNQSMNRLTLEEKTEGWRLLFDGQTTNGWRNYQKESIGSSWVVQEGSLTLEVEGMEDGRTR
ncbi:MAG: ThuA domain-containing protein, partial [Saprospiraceae bacterium]|nr:ThuA domain-containing protein [Saprospiraceae bacterium]